MKFIIHLSSKAKLDPLFQKSLEATMRKILAAGHLVEQFDFTDDVAVVSAERFRPQAGEQHIVCLAGDDEYSQIAALKKLEHAPLTFWRGKKVDPEETAFACLGPSPDIMILENGALSAVDSRFLADHNTFLTQLLDVEKVFSGAELTSSSLQLKTHLLSLSADFIDKNIVTVHLDGDVEGPDGELVKQFTIEDANKLALNIKQVLEAKNLLNDETALVLAPSMTTGLYDIEGTKFEKNPHSGEEAVGVDIVTEHFVMELIRLVEGKLPDYNIYGIPAKDDLLPDAAMIDLTVSHGGLAFMPMSATHLVQHSIAVGSSVIAYGEAPSASIGEWHEAGMISMMDKDGAITHKESQLESSVDALCHQLLTLAASRPTKVTVPAAAATDVKAVEDEAVSTWKSSARRYASEATKPNTWQFWSAVTVGAAVVTGTAVAISKGLSSNR